MSTHEVKVVRIDHIEPHPNADRLEIVKIWDYVCVVGKGEYKVGDLAAYIEPDYVVDTLRHEFRFLAKPEQKGGITITEYGKKRIKAQRFRGVWSSGLLIPAPEGSKEGDNVMQRLEIERWEPKMTGLVRGGGGDLGSSMPESGPEFDCPKYDLENVRKYHKVIEPGEEVILTAKLHGCNGRFTYSNGRMYCGSRTQWKKEPGYYWHNKKNKFFGFVISLLQMFFTPEQVFKFMTERMPFRILRKYNQKLTYFVSDNAWWEATKQNPWLVEWCKLHPNVVVYGEVVGPGIQGEKFHYGFKKGEIGFFVFDILEKNRWIPNNEFDQDVYTGLKFVPTLYRGPFDMKIVEELAEQKETFNNANHIREGVVIKVINERINQSIGRVALKYVSNLYLDKS